MLVDSPPKWTDSDYLDAYIPTLFEATMPEVEILKKE